MRLLFFLTLSAWACGIVNSDRILGKDVAATSPVFAALDPSLEIASAPLAGVQRVFRPDELVHLAKQYGIGLEGPIGAICFERATTPLTAEILLPVLRQALAVENAKIDILDFSRFGDPNGSIEFPRSALTPNGLWRGRVLYGDNHSTPIWVKTRITVERRWVEAAETLAVGKPIEPSQLIIRVGPRFPFDPPLVESIDILIGRRPVRTLPAGTPISAIMLTIPHDVERGDLVAVEVRVGSAVLDFEATAESSGRTGESVMVKNPENGRSFQAKIQDKGHVVVEK